MKWGVRKNEQESEQERINRDNNRTKIERDKLKYKNERDIRAQNRNIQNAQENREHRERLRKLALIGTAITAASTAWKAYQRRKEAGERAPETIINNFPSKTEVFAEFIPKNASYAISHSGVKGMKWGVRNYQNEDGTLTDAGKARYRNTPKGPIEFDARMMTNDELDYANNRFNKEKTYNSNTGHESRNPGFKRNLAEKTIISGAGTFALTAASSLVYNLYGPGRKHFENNSGEINKGSLAKRVLANAGIAAGIAGITAFSTATGKANNVSSIAPLDKYGIVPDDKKVNEK